MISNIFGLLTIFAACLWAWPLTRRLLHIDNAVSPQLEPLALVTGVGLSLGSLSFLMLWLGLLPGVWLRPAIVLALPWAGLLISLWLGRDTLRGRVSIAPTLRANPTAAGLLLLAIGSLTVIAINAISYPFYRYDVLARFAPNARLLYTAQHIPTELSGYPLGAQLLYSFGFMAAGSVNDHFAGIFVAVLAAGALGSVWVVTRLMFSKTSSPARIAWAATILTLSAPLVIDWGTSAYVDLPEGFYHGLTFAMALLWLRHGESRYALLAGVLSAMALWVKQSALVLLPALAVVPLLRLLPAKGLTMPTAAQIRRETWLVLLALGAATLLAGPWYLRSYLLGGIGNVIPAPGAFDAQSVDRSLNALIVFWARRSEWGPVLAAFALLGITLALLALLWPQRIIPRAPAADTRRMLLLFAAFVVPNHLAWWWQFTYQTRYLLVSLPMYVALAGFAVDWLWRQSEQRLPAIKRIPVWTVLPLAAALLYFGAENRLGAVYYLITDPLQSDSAKLTRLSSVAWPVTEYIRSNLPPGTSIYAMDGALAYWLYDYDFQQGYPATLATLEGYDYFIVASWSDWVYTGLGNPDNEVVQALDDNTYFTEVYRSKPGGGTVIYRVTLP